MGLTVQQLELSGAIEALADTFRTEPEVTQVLSKIPELSRAQLRSIETMTPAQFWADLVRKLENGLISNGLEKLMAAAAKAYPGHSKFVPYSNRAGRPTTETTSSSVLIESDETDRKSVRWYSNTTTELLISNCWGYHERDARTSPVEISYAPSFNEHVTLAYALIRLGIHGGISVLHVRDPESWEKRVKKNMPGCMGYRTAPRDWIPTQDVSSKNQWIVRTILPDASSTEDCLLLPSTHAAASLSRAMDDWALRRLDYLISNIIDGDGVTLLQMKVGEEFLLPIKNLWDEWKGQLETGPGTTHGFLRYMLATSNSFDEPASGLRIGPKTTDTCLLQGAIFALATGVATNKTVPLVGPRSNLEHAGEPAHLIGLELIDGREIQDRFAQMPLQGGYSFLAGEKSSVKALRELTRKFSEPDKPPVTVNRLHHSNVRLLTRDAGFREAIGQTPSKLATYLQGVIKEQEQTSNQSLKQSSDVEMERENVN